jgi:DnaJ-class molecular chaperone
VRRRRYARLVLFELSTDERQTGRLEIHEKICIYGDIAGLQSIAPAEAGMGVGLTRYPLSCSADHPHKTALSRQEPSMTNEKGPNIKKKQKCKNCEGKGLLKKGDKVVKCQRCKGTGVR